MTDQHAYRAQYSRDWYRLNKRHKKDVELQKRYGISLAEYEQLLAEQGGGCKLCGITPEEEGCALAVDHDHATKRVRGLLCSRCNSLVIGSIEAIGLDRIMEYLQWKP
jgi:hypothetical protein